MKDRNNNNSIELKRRFCGQE